MLLKKNIKNKLKSCLFCTSISEFVLAIRVLRSSKNVLASARMSALFSNKNEEI